MLGRFNPLLIYKGLISIITISTFPERKLPVNSPIMNKKLINQTFSLVIKEIEVYFLAIPFTRVYSIGEPKNKTIVSLKGWGRWLN